MSTHCRRHPDDTQSDEGCWGCHQEGAIFIEAFGAVGFTGQIDMNKHHENTGLNAVALLRKAHHWGCADLLEAAIRAWNAMPKNNGHHERRHT